MTKGPRPLVIRKVLPSDAEQIVGLFDLVYNGGYGIDECRDIETVRKILREDRDIWHVATDGDKVVASTVGMPSRWNRTYETCRGATHPDYRRGGMASALYKSVLEACYAKEDCDLTFGFPRTFGMYRIMQREAYSPFLATGYDGGMHITDRKREYHLVGINANVNKMLSRVAVPGSKLMEDSFVKENIISRIRFGNEFGDYPEMSIVGPVNEARLMDNFGISCCYMRLSHSVQIVDSTGNNEGDNKNITKAIENFLKEPPFKVEHAFAFVLADKEGLAKDLYGIGFEITSYIPAWYCEGGKRYDCIMMVKKSYDEKPVMHQTEEMIGNFSANFERLLKDMGG